MFPIRTLLTLCSLIACANKSLASNLASAKGHSIQRRTLIYPVTAPTRLQFIGGIGIPVEDLKFESVTSGFVLKAEYFLPTTADEWHPNYLRPQSINRRSATNATQHHYANGAYWTSASIYRWIIYKGIEMVLERGGFRGNACVLRSICEHAAVPFHYESGILAEILHIVLTPSTSRDDLTKPAHRHYLKAEYYGRQGGDCALKYSECPNTPVQLISTVFELDD